MTVQEVDLLDGAALGNQRVGVGQAIVGGVYRVPGGQVTPVFGDVDVGGRVGAMGLGSDQRE